jgi:hypothetical protein
MPVVSFTDIKRAVRQDLNYEQGTDLEFPITVNINGSELDATNYTAKLQVREYTEGSDVLYEMSTENGRISTTGGTVKLVFAAADLQGATWTAGEYDLKIASPGSPGKATRIMEGKFYIDPEVTR